MHKGENATGATSTSSWTFKRNSFSKLRERPIKGGGGCYEGAIQSTNVLTSSKQPHYIYTLGIFSRLLKEKAIFLYSIQWEVLLSPIQTRVTDSRRSTWNQGVQNSFEKTIDFRGD